MTREEFELFLLCSAGLCLVMAIVNTIRKRYWMGCAFLAVAGAMMLYRGSFDNTTVGLVGFVAGGFLVGDIVTRLRKQPIREPNE